MTIKATDKQIKIWASELNAPPKKDSRKETNVLLPNGCRLYSNGSIHTHAPDGTYLHWLGFMSTEDIEKTIRELLLIENKPTDWQLIHALKEAINNGDFSCEDTRKKGKASLYIVDDGDGYYWTGFGSTLKAKLYLNQ